MDSFEAQVEVVTQLGFTGNEARAIVECHAEGWSWYYCRGKHRIKGCKKAYAALDLWQKQQHS